MSVVLGRTYRIYTGAHGARFVANTSIGPVVAHTSRVSGCGVTRMYAGQDAAALIHSVGLHTQQEVINMHAAGIPGYGPANPVSRSTHCERNDGVAYPRLPAGAPLPKWGCGADLEIAKIGDFIATAAREHNIVTRTYPGAPGEAQHVNFRRAPRFPKVNLWKVRPLRHGSKGARVRFITRMLCKIPDAQGHRYLTEPSNTMTARVVNAVREFQADHHQKADGIVGVQTRSQIVASYRWHKKGK